MLRFRLMKNSFLDFCISSTERKRGKNATTIESFSEQFRALLGSDSKVSGLKSVSLLCMDFEGN